MVISIFVLYIIRNLKIIFKFVSSNKFLLFVSKFYTKNLKSMHVINVSKKFYYKFCKQILK